MAVINNIEKRFLEIAGIDCDLNKFPLEKEDCPQIEKDKEKSNLHGEVFTPLWLVDKMILKAADSLKKAKTTHDLCTGYGQFTIRMLRFLANNKKNFSPNIWLKKTHSFSEYQISSVYKLLYIFGVDINLFIGDAKQLDKLKDIDNGVLFYSPVRKKWFNITKIIKTIFDNQNKYSIKAEERFVKKFNKIKEDKEKEGGQNMLFNIGVQG